MTSYSDNKLSIQIDKITKQVVMLADKSASFSARFKLKGGPFNQQLIKTTYVKVFTRFLICIIRVCFFLKALVE